MVLLTGDETPAEIILLAYGMEEGLRGFYESIAKSHPDSSLSDLLSKLAGVEVGHKARLQQLYLSFAEGPKNPKEFEEKVVSQSMEGGYTTEEFLEQNRPSLENETDLLSLAMMLETQALDLYMRYSRKSEDERSKTLLYDLAEEEKNHLALLGRLVEIRSH